MIFLNNKQCDAIKNNLNSAANQNFISETVKNFDKEVNTSFVYDQTMKLIDETILRIKDKEKQLDEKSKKLEQLEIKLNNRSNIIENKTDYHNVKIGDIFYTSWGYEQTNVEFYEVDKVIGKKTVILKELHTLVYEESDTCFSGKKIPVRGEFKENKKTLRKRISMEYSNDPIIKINHSINAWLWDGKPVDFSSYA